ncbi:MAG: tripartite tricarboxylate transporter substrate binding protein [Hyphomicrobiales bacterium]|nr:tripartite tricarboxylate transporter substrate binding protein [Alphaproteobacteria bacterium]
MAGMRDVLAAVACALLAFSTPSSAQDYPNRPVRLVVPFPPGGINDIVARVLSQHLGERLGKQVIVDNRGGAGGVVGSEIVANAPKDGHTLLIVSLAGAVNPWLYTLPYDPVKSFAPVAMLVAAPNVVTVNPGLPVNSIKELVALAKAKPGELQYASSGVGTFLHLAGELFKITANVDILHIPFRGAGPALIDVVAGHTKIAFGSVTSSAVHIRPGKLRALGVGSTMRSPVLPDVPTVIEAGVPGYEAANWIGVVATGGTPEPIVARLHKEISEIMATPDVQKLFAAEGADIVSMSAAQFGAYMADEIVKWGRVVKQAGIKAQ